MTEMTAPLPAASLRRDQEDVRLVTGFADIFAAVVMVGGLFALVGFASALMGPAAGLVGAAAVWFLPVPLVERRQFAACALVLSLAFAVTVALPSFALLDIFGALPVAAAMYFYWQRYKIPLSAAIGIAAVVAFPALVILKFVAGSDNSIDDFDALAALPGWISLGVGLVLFVLAMRWDLTDRERVTRRSDVAFWLHVMAGPLAVHGLFSLLGITRFDGGETNAWPAVALFALFTVTAVTIDRRPLLLSSFGYFLFALGQIVYRQIAPGAATGVTSQAVSIPQAIMFATFGGGLLVAVLAAGWSSLRRILLAAMPEAIVAMVPPVTDWTPPTDRQTSIAKGESEPLRLVLGLNDYLATLALGVLFVGGLAAAYLIFYASVQQVIASGFGEQEGKALVMGWTPWLAWAVPISITLIAAEVFVRRQRMALTAVSSAGQFAILIVLGGVLFLWQAGGGEVKAPGAGLIIFACLAAAVLNWGFGWWNRIPISAAYGALMLLPIVFLDVVLGFDARVGNATPIGFGETQIRLLLFGGVAFVAAVVLDRSDPARTTQRADVAFWLHLLASLFIVIILFRWTASLATPSLATIALFIGLTIVALVINRRAPLLVGIPFVISAISMDDPTTGLLVQLVFFGLLMALVLYWEKVRGQIMALAGRSA